MITDSNFRDFATKSSMMQELIRQSNNVLQHSIGHMNQIIGGSRRGANFRFEQHP